MTVKELRQILANQDDEAYVVVATDTHLLKLEQTGKSVHTLAIWLLGRTQTELSSPTEAGKGIVIAIPSKEERNGVGD